LPDVNSGNETAVSITGTTVDVASGSTVTLTINDTDGATAAVTVTAIVQADGSYATTANLSSLTNGNLTVNASATDHNSQPVQNTDIAIKNAVAGSIHVQVDNVDDGASTLDLSGTTSNVNVGATVTLTITSPNGGAPVVVTGQVQVGGGYSMADVDISGLTDGPLTITAETTDLSGNAIDDDTTAALNALTGALTVQVDEVDDANQLIDI